MSNLNLNDTVPLRSLESGDGKDGIRRLVHRFLGLRRYSSSTLDSLAAIMKVDEDTLQACCSVGHLPYQSSIFILYS